MNALPDSLGILVNPNGGFDVIGAYARTGGFHLLFTSPNPYQAQLFGEWVLWHMAQCNQEPGECRGFVEGVHTHQWTCPDGHESSLELCQPADSVPPEQLLTPDRSN